MSNKAIIKILSNATMEGDDLIEVISPGTFEKIESEFIAKYVETEISGMDGTETTLRLGDKYVVLEREGSTSTRMHFEKGESTVSLYNTPYGMLELSIHTKKLECNMDENGGNVLIEYEMMVGDQEPIRTKLRLEVEKKN